jgi:hypothetical protein
MRVVVLLPVLLCPFVSALAAGPVYIPDPNLKAAIEQELWVSDPTLADMLGLSSLHMDDREISDLTGLECATNLTDLEIRFAGLTDISILAGLTNLQELVLNNNNISDISAVSGLTNLEVLDIHNNDLTDISAVSGLTNLHTLYFRINHISDISALSGLTNLETLVLRDNEISDLSPLAGLTKLRFLSLSSNEISDVSPLSGLSDLRDVTLSINQISDISPLAGLTSLNILTLDGNPLNQEAYDTYLPQILANNPGIYLPYDPRVTYPMLISSTIGGTVKLPGEGEFTCGEGEGITLEAVADPGFAFVSWSGSYYTTKNPAYIVTYEEHRIQANFVSLLDPLHVDDNGPDDPSPEDTTISDPGENGTAEHPFDMIQEAITVARDGSTILVHPGRYRENIDLLGKSIQLVGMDPNDPPGAAWPVIDGGSGPVVRFVHNESRNCRMCGFIITGGCGLPASAIQCSQAGPTIANCLIVCNRADGPSGAVVHCKNSDALFTNCTISSNICGEQDAVLCAVDSHVSVSNSILWGNAPDLLFHDGVGGISVSCSDVAGNWPGAGNISGDPLFVRPDYTIDLSDSIGLESDDPSTNGTVGDYHLQSQAGRWGADVQAWIQDMATSPCIDAGDPCCRVGGEPLPNGGMINMGAYGGTSEASMSYQGQ